MGYTIEEHIYGIPAPRDESVQEGFRRSVTVKVRVAAGELERWKAAAPGGNVSALVRVSVARELERRERQAVDVEPAASSPDPLAELLERYGT